MSDKPRLLDLFCGAGGAGEGYHRAGFDVTGVDIEPHPDNPHPVIVGDALELIRDRRFLDGFDVIHASPPCPAYSTITPNPDQHTGSVEVVRTALRAWGGRYVIENVPGAPLPGALLMCGGAFGLGTTCRDGVWRPLRRHRMFESNVFLLGAGCACSGRQAVGVYGNGGGGQSTRPSGGKGYKGHREERQNAMGIDWMTSRTDLSDAIPPVYTEHIGWQLLRALS